MTQTYQLYGLGAALVDTEVRVSDAFLSQHDFTKGQMSLASELEQGQLLKALATTLDDHQLHCGGSAANSVMAFSAFGGSAYFACKVGDDDDGRFYLNGLQDVAIGYAKRYAAKQTTGKCVVMISDDAERTMQTHLGVNVGLSIDDIDEQALKHSQWLYFEGYLVTTDSAKQAAIHARKVAQTHGVKVALSFSDPGIVQGFKQGLIEMMGERPDWVFCNEEEAYVFCDTRSLDKAVAHLQSIAHGFAITLGDKGALVFDGAHLHTIAAIDVQAIDTNGAGDAFAGGFMYGITHGLNAKQAGDLGAATAAKVVCHYGPRLPKEVYRELWLT